MIFILMNSLQLGQRVPSRYITFTLHVQGAGIGYSGRRPFEGKESER